MSQPLATFQTLDLEPEFPCELYLTSSKLFADVIFCHWHEAFEFILVCQGRLQLTVDLKTLVVEAGEAVVVNPGEIHFGNAADGAYCEARALVFAPEFLDGSANERPQTQYIDPVKNGTLVMPRHLNRQEHAGLLEMLWGFIPLMDRKEPAWELAAKARLLGMLAGMYAQGLMHNPAQAGTPDPTLARLKKALGYLSHNHARKVYIADAAAEAAMSEDYFYRFFKKHTRMSPVEYLTRYRMQEAKKLLQSTELSITQVCFSVGFEQVSHFIRMFTRHAGCTPNVWRTRHLQAQEAPVEKTSPGESTFTP